MTPAALTLETGFRKGARSVSKTTLRQELIAAGLRPLSTERVDEHIRRMNTFNRPTAWHWVLFYLSQLVWYCTLVPLVEMLSKRVSPAIQDMLALLLLLGLPVVAGGGYWFTSHDGFTLLVVPHVALMLTALFWLVAALADLESLVRAVPAWRRVSPKNMPLNQLPAEVLRDAKQALEIPGAKVHYLVLEEDPFQIVTRGRWPFTEEVTINAWDTGDPELNTVHRVINGRTTDFRHPAFGGGL